MTPEQSKKRQARVEPILSGFVQDMAAFTAVVLLVAAMVTIGLMIR